MSRLRSSLCLIATVFAGVSAFIGPVINELEIVNEVIAPDGYSRV